MRFKEARKKAGIKLNDAAAALGVSKQAVNAWERGEYEPGNAALTTMAKLYGCSVDELLSADGASDGERGEDGA